MLDPLINSETAVAIIVDRIFGKLSEKAKFEKLHDELFKDIYNLYSANKNQLILFKTLLSKGKTVDFERIYYPLSIIGNEVGNSILIEENITTLFDNSKRIAIVGYAGSGKTMITKRIFLSALKSLNRIPIIIELRKLEIEQTIYDYIKSLILRYRENCNDDVFHNILDSGEFLFIFDGYDEIPLNEKKRVTNDIVKFTNGFKDNSFILTSRFGVGAENLDTYDTFYINQLSSSDIQPFINLQCKNLDNGVVLANNILQSLQNRDVNNNYMDYFKSPLLLTLFIKTFKLHPEIPTHKCDFYDNVFNTLWSDHDSITKPEGNPRTKNFDKSTYLNLLQSFSYNSLKDDNYVFSEKDIDKYIKIALTDESIHCEEEIIKRDLVTSISILIEEGNEYMFPHSSMEEFFAAGYIAKYNEKNKVQLYKEFANYYLLFENLLSILSEVDKYYFHKLFLNDYISNSIKKINHYLNELANSQRCTLYQNTVTIKHILVFLCDTIHFILLLNLKNNKTQNMNKQLENILKKAINYKSLIHNNSRTLKNMMLIIIRELNVYLNNYKKILSDISEQVKEFISNKEKTPEPFILIKKTREADKK